MSILKYPVTDIRLNTYHLATIIRRFFLNKIYGMTIGENTRISSKARLDFTNPKGIDIGSHTQITLGVTILTHDFVGRKHCRTRIGNYCFIGANAVIMPGIEIGDHCIVGAGSVVTRDIPAHSVVAGNPARIVRSDIETGEYGILVDRSAPPN